MEKRRCRRKIKRVNISFSDGKDEYRGVSSDFSCNGLFIRTRKGFQIGTPLTMKLEFDDGSIVPLKGTVMRAVKTSLEIQKNGMGVLLSSPPQEYDDFIKDLYKD